MFPQTVRQRDYVFNCLGAPALTNFQTARTDVIMFLTISGHVETVVLLTKKS